MLNVQSKHSVASVTAFDAIPEELYPEIFSHTTGFERKMILSLVCKAWKIFFDKQLDTFSKDNFDLVSYISKEPEEKDLEFQIRLNKTLKYINFYGIFSIKEIQTVANFDKGHREFLKYDVKICLLYTS